MSSVGSAACESPASTADRPRAKEHPAGEPNLAKAMAELRAKLGDEVLRGLKRSSDRFARADADAGASHGAPKPGSPSSRALKSGGPASVSALSGEIAALSSECTTQGSFSGKEVAQMTLNSIRQITSAVAQSETELRREIGELRSAVEELRSSTEWGGASSGRHSEAAAHDELRSLSQRVGDIERAQPVVERLARSFGQCEDRHAALARTVTQLEGRVDAATAAERASREAELSALRAQLAEELALIAHSSKSEGPKSGEPGDVPPPEELTTVAQFRSALGAAMTDARQLLEGALDEQLRRSEDIAREWARVQLDQLAGALEAERDARVAHVDEVSKDINARLDNIAGDMGYLRASVSSVMDRRSSPMCRRAPAQGMILQPPPMQHLGTAPRPQDTVYASGDVSFEAPWGLGRYFSSPSLPVHMERTKSVPALHGSPSRSEPMARQPRTSLDLSPIRAVSPGAARRLETVSSPSATTAVGRRSVSPILVQRPQGAPPTLITTVRSPATAAYAAMYLTTGHSAPASVNIATAGTSKAALGGSLSGLSAGAGSDAAPLSVGAMSVGAPAGHSASAPPAAASAPNSAPSSVVTPAAAGKRPAGSTPRLPAREMMAYLAQHGDPRLYKGDGAANSSDEEDGKVTRRRQNGGAGTPNVEPPSSSVGSGGRRTGRRRTGASSGGGCGRGGLRSPSRNASRTGSIATTNTDASGASGTAAPPPSAAVTARGVSPTRPQQASGSASARPSTKAAPPPALTPPPPAHLVASSTGVFQRSSSPPTPSRLSAAGVARRSSGS